MSPTHKNPVVPPLLFALGRGCDGRASRTGSFYRLGSVSTLRSTVCQPTRDSGLDRGFSTPYEHRSSPEKGKALFRYLTYCPLSYYKIYIISLKHSLFHLIIF
jgi:hypothetical protein